MIPVRPRFSDTNPSSLIEAKHCRCIDNLYAPQEDSAMSLHDGTQFDGSAPILNVTGTW